MKVSSEKSRRPVIGLIAVLALLVTLAGWLLKPGGKTTAPAAQAEKQASVLANPGAGAVAGVAESQAQPAQAVAAVKPGSTGGAGPGWVRRLESAEQSPAWAVKYGAEFWRRAGAAGEATGASAQRGAQLPAGMSLGEVVDRVSHAWLADGAGSVPEVRSVTYTATLKEDGLAACRT